MMTTTLTQTLKNVFTYRHAMNPGRLRIVAKDLSCVVYFYKNVLGQPCAVAYRGRAKKPSFKYRYSSEESRANSVAEWMKAIQESTKSRRVREPRELNVGDVLMSMWGYEQTNIDYYLVTQRIGTSSVEIVEIGKIQKETEWMQGKVIPNKDKIIGEPMRRRVNGNRVRINECCIATKEEPKIIAGCEVYNAVGYSSYH